MIGLGVLGALGFLLFARPRVEADARGVRVRNMIGSYELPWEVVRGVRFDRGAPWVSLELHDDDLRAGAGHPGRRQGARGATAVRALRALHEARQARLASRIGRDAAIPHRRAGLAWSRGLWTAAYLVYCCRVDHCLPFRAGSRESGAPAPTRVAAPVAGSGHRFRACPGARVRDPCDRADRSSGPWHAPGPSAFRVGCHAGSRTGSAT